MKLLRNLLLIACVASTAAIAQISQAESLAPEAIHRATTLEILQSLQRDHFAPLKIDDKLSQEFLANYLDAVDGSRQTFLQDDIDKYTQRYGKTLDDSLLRGDVEAGFVIFNSYRDRMSAQLQKQLLKMPDMITGFDYTKDESVLIDRSKANWPQSRKEVDDIFRKRLKAASLSLRLSGKENPEIIEVLSKRYKNQLDRLQQLNNEDVFQLYINAFTQLYDPHTNYLSPASSKNFDISMSLKLEGIGAMLRMKDEYTQVVRLIHAGPAFKQGHLKPSDRIVGVAQGDKEMVDVVGWRLDEVVDLIRGPKGSVVKLELIPAKAVSDDERKIIAITRDEVKLEEQSVQKTMLEVKDAKGKVHKIGVLDIPTFYIDFDALRKRDPNYKSTTRDTAKLLSELVNDDAEGIIIDLRGNGGGSLKEANELTGLFIERGPSVQIQGADKRVHNEAKTYFSPYYDGPVIVLINRMSASASEIFAGALQDYNRAVIVGSDSFGKGTVQGLASLNHGKLKMTQSRFYRISGDSTQDRGVSPDIALPEMYDISLIGEASLDHAMQWDSIAPARYRPLPSLAGYVERLRGLSSARTDKNADFIYVKAKASYEDSMKLTDLSLNEKQRKALKESDKSARLALENSHRKAKGEEPLSKLEDENPDEEPIEDESAKGIDKDDAYLIEAANILVDFKELLHTEYLQLAK